VMYITADGDATDGETVLAPMDALGYQAYAEGATQGPASVDSEDVQKAGTIFTNTPDGRMRLVDYLANVEKEIAAEEAARKRDVAAVRAQMARNFAFNKAARAKMQKALLHKMAVNAKKAKDDLHKAMTFVQAKFASAAALANKRNKANKARSKALRKVIRANKKEASQKLKTKVKAQQKSMAALKSAMNARIDKTQKNVAINAAQIKENAKAARKALESAVNKFDHKVANAAAEAKAGRSKLAQQLKDQDKAIREMANNKLKVVMTKTAAHFDRVRSKMAEDRAHADAALKAASTQMTASMNAFTALNDKRFKQTVSDIAAAKKEAKDRVDAASTEFKSKILQLRATVNQQVAKTNARISQLSGVVEKNRLAQAKVNANVEAEMKRMVKVGNDRYAEHLKKDQDLKNLIDKNKAATDARLAAMSAQFSTELDAVRATMNKNRAHASKMLAKKTSALYDNIAKSEKAQMEENKAMAKQTALAKMDLEDSLREAKSDFTNRLGKLHSTIVANDKKFEKKIDNLAGIVRANAVKSKKGREHLASVMAANKAELHKAVGDAIHQGETRMMAAEQKLKDMNAKTKASLNMRITSEITKLSNRAKGQIEGLRLQTKEARAAMKKEMLFAVRAAAEEAKANLADAVKTMKEEFTNAEAEEAAAAKADAKAREAIAAKIEFEKLQSKRALDDAVKSMERSLLSLKAETRAKIKKTNTRVDAYGAALSKEAKDVEALMATNMATLTQKISNAEEKATAHISAADAASAAGYKKALESIKSDLADAKKKSDGKFGKMYDTLAQTRSEMEKKLAGSVTEINDSIAKQAALADSRFSKTVKDIDAARAEAATQVKDARKSFATSMATLTASVKAQEKRLLGDVQVVSGMVLDNQAEQVRINRRTEAELTRVMGLVNDNATKSKKARGKIRLLLDENKRAAHDEVEALEKLFDTKIGKIRHKAAANSIEAAMDLTGATEKMYGELASVQLKAAYDNEQSAASIAKYEADAAANIADAKKNFNARLEQLGNVVVSNAKKIESGFEVLTGVVRDEKSANEKELALISEQTAAFQKDMNGRIVKAIMKGEAAAKRVAERAQANLKGMKKGMLVEISERVEATADKLFATIQGDHQKIADNYLSLKAYAVTASGKLNDYVTKGKGKNLSSLGDLMTTIASTANIPTVKAEGLGFGGDTIPSIFSNGKISVLKKNKDGKIVEGKVSKINGLVNEYTGNTNAVRGRWPMGLGKYLLMKLEESMLEKGVLQVDKVSEKSGNFVFLNGHAVGLSNKLNDFESLAVRMAAYEQTLAKLTAALSGKHKPTPPKKKIPYASPPEWDGN